MFMANEYNGYLLAAPISRNFVITYGSPVEFGLQDTDAYRRARAIANSCEADLKRLEALFHCDFQSGGRNRYGTWVHVGSSDGDGNGDVSNRGWGRDESSRIHIGRTMTPLRPPQSLTSVFDDCARMFFVAEMCEILMDFTGYGWNREASNGEALSVVLAAELYPAGYYLSGRGGPRVNEWLRDPARPDWVTSTEGTDKNSVSYGCGALFINYLRTQLGFQLDAIITRPNCSTLAQTFDALTGRGVNFAFPAFENLIAQHLPRDPKVWVATDDIFPLYNEDRRSVGLTSSWMLISRERAKAPEGLVVLHAGIRCKSQEYEYWRTKEVNQLDVLAKCRGFGQANVTWAINGVPLPTHGTQAWIDVTAVLTEENPGGSKTTLPTKTTRLTYVIRDSLNRSQLSVRNTDNIGNYTLDFSASAKEASGLSAGVTTRTDSMTMVEVGFEVDARYYRDRRRCNPEIDQLSDSLVHLVKELEVLKNGPDPQPEQFVDRVLDAAAHVLRQLEVVAASEQASVERLRRDLSVPGRLAAELEHAQRLNPSVRRDQAADQERVIAEHVASPRFSSTE
jgi:hypothetical protein